VKRSTVKTPEGHPVQQADNVTPSTTGKPRGKESTVSKLNKVMDDLRHEINTLVEITTKLDLKASPPDMDESLMAKYVGDTILMHLLGEIYMKEIQPTEAEKSIRLRNAVIGAIKNYKKLMETTVARIDETGSQHIPSIRERIFYDLTSDLKIYDI
jgi:hypothetical protein